MVEAARVWQSVLNSRKVGLRRRKAQQDGLSERLLAQNATLSDKEQEESRNEGLV
jgi:hypothetical protein